MNALTNVIGGLWKPLGLGLLVLIGMGFLAEESGTGFSAAGSFECNGFTNDPDLNRLLCQYSPARIWNMPVSELLPFLASDPSGTEPATATAG